MRKSTIYLFVLGLAATAALASASLLVSAQNMNSMNMGNSNTSTKKPKPRRPKPKGMTMGRCDNTKQEQADLEAERASNDQQAAVDIDQLSRELRRRRGDRSC